jgi:hypothetical protein
VAAQDDPDGLRVFPPDLRDIQAELETRPSPRHPRHPVAEASLGQRLAVPGRGQRDARVRVQVVDVRYLDQAMHGGVDRRRRTAFTPEAVVERRHHLVLPVDPGVDVHQGAEPVKAEHGQPGCLQRAQVTAGALHPHQLDVLAGNRVGSGALG